MIIHDFECQDCGKIKELFIPYEFGNTCVCECGGIAKKIITFSQTAPGDAGWIKSVLDVVDKNPDKPHCQEFLRHPTRENYQVWMKGEGLRPLEPGEKPKRPDKEGRKKRMKEQLHKKYRERNAISI
ncbi:MAG: zinc ribbon domain-containing protein [Desulfobulbaceae bacterium]|uniref:Zinc ribbon domain-containing protein n=1 Tax=Candidatus Desulfobia pelagia TaxID=2841692 RepID=A0A8J6NE98_9BACT|nr:zinc ribbon domain-containing protein [Candidatus Desulfobia pelagia]